MVKFFVLRGQVPAQKNGKSIVVNKRTGKPFIVSNEKVRAWKLMTAYDIPVAARVEGEVEISLKFWNKDARKRDLDNMMTSVLDLLKNNGVIEDDNCFIVKKLSGEFMGVDKENPRVEVEIK